MAEGPERRFANEGVIAQFRANAASAEAGAPKRMLLLLTTTGARTGSPRVAPLVYSMAGERFVVVASKGGAPAHPDWFVNLRANPEVTVEVGSERFAARAVIVGSEARRAELYAAHAAAIPAAPFLDYQQKTTRRIPVVLLERAATR